MAQRPEHRPGTAVPDAGTYEQLNIFGHPTGIRIVVADAHLLPPAPRGTPGPWWTRPPTTRLATRLLH
jgi:hypothetical protein